jgi:hypothetical protein
LSADASLTWQPAQEFALDTSFGYFNNDFSGSVSGTDRTEEGTSGSARLLWRLSSTSSLHLTALSDSVDSSVDFDDLDENRLELAFTGIY